MIKNSIETSVKNVLEFDEALNVKKYGATGNGTTDDYGAINSAISALAGSGDLYFPKGTYRIASNLTMAAGIRYVPEQGAMISVDSGKTLTINSAPDAGLYQIFSGSGTVSFGTGMKVYPEWFGTGTAAFQAALNSLTNGGILSCIASSYTLTSTVTISNSNVLIEGRDNCQLRPTETAYAFTINANNITIQNLDFYKCSIAQVLASHSNINFRNLTADGNLTSGFLAPQSIIFTKVNDILVEGCSFKNYDAGVYLGGDATTQCNRVRIINNHFWHETGVHGQVSQAYPVAVYIYFANDVLVSGNLIENIISGSASGNSTAIYAGDGSSTKITVTNNIITYSDTLQGTTIPILIGQGNEVIVTGNQVDIQSGSGFIQVENVTDAIIKSNILKNTHMFTKTSIQRLIIEGNIISGAASQGIYCDGGAASTPIANAQITNNFLYNTTKGLFVRYCTRAYVRQNSLIDGNTGNTAFDSNNPQSSCGIVVMATSYAEIFNNYVANISALGHLKYGLVVHSEVGCVYRDNIIRGMETDDYYTGSAWQGLRNTSPATSEYATDHFIWNIGDNVSHIIPTANGSFGWICTEDGTTGTLNSGNTTGTIAVGSASLVVNTATELARGQYINIAGVTGTFCILAVSGTTITLSANSDASVTNAAVSYHTPLFSTFAPILTNNMLQLSTLRALDVNGLRIADDAGLGGIFIKDGGNVGVNNINPSYKMHVETDLFDSPGIYVKGIGSDGEGIIRLDTTNNARTSKIIFTSAGGQPFLVGQLRDGGSPIPQILSISTNSDISITPPQLCVTSTGNIGVGTRTFGTSAQKTVCLANGVAPTSSPADSVQLYAEDVVTSELKVRDEAGNVVTLSPHPSKYLDNCSPSIPYPAGYHAKNEYIGKEIFIDTVKLAMLVEELTGEKIIHIEDIPIVDWDETQESIRLQKEKQIADSLNEIERLEKEIKTTGDEKAKQSLIQEKNRIIIPQPYVKKSPPAWLKNRMK